MKCKICNQNETDSTSGICDECATKGQEMLKQAKQILAKSKKQNERLERAVIRADKITENIETIDKKFNSIEKRNNKLIDMLI